MILLHLLFILSISQIWSAYVSGKSLTIAQVKNNTKIVIIFTLFSLYIANQGFIYFFLFLFLMCIEFWFFVAFKEEARLKIGFLLSLLFFNFLPLVLLTGEKSSATMLMEGLAEKAAKYAMEKSEKLFTKYPKSGNAVLAATIATGVIYAGVSIHDAYVLTQVGSIDVKLEGVNSTIVSYEKEVELFGETVETETKVKDLLKEQRMLISEKGDTKSKILWKKPFV